MDEHGKNKIFHISLIFIVLWFFFTILFFTSVTLMKNKTNKKKHNIYQCRTLMLFVHLICTLIFFFKLVIRQKKNEMIRILLWKKILGLQIIEKKQCKNIKKYLSLVTRIKYSVYIVDRWTSVWNESHSNSSTLI